MGKSIKSLAVRIEADNERFINLSKAEKRVEIARDCLERIALKQLTIVRGRTVDYFDSDIDFNSSIKEVINSQKLPECNVCAKGGLFMSYVGRVNECTFTDIEDDSTLDSYEMQKLQEIFEPHQLDIIETAFEKFVVCGDYEFEYLEEFDAAKYYRDYLDLDDKDNKDDLTLKSICKNIIKNKGEFVPSDIVSPNARIK